MSMGGMIAQTLSARHAERVKSLTSLFSTTGSLKVGQPAFKAILQLIRRPPRDRQEAARDYVDFLRVVGSSTEWSESRHRQYAEQAWKRGGGLRNNVGTGRQIGAIINSGDRTAELRRVRCPTLVIHGDRDLMVATSGGYATAAAIGGARLVILPGMGHDIPPGLVNILINLIAGHVRSRYQSPLKEV
jgi:pimeloyl-ACP methyl ester carboxylesterase